MRVGDAPVDDETGIGVAVSVAHTVGSGLGEETGGVAFTDDDQGEASQVPCLHLRRISVCACIAQ